MNALPLRTAFLACVLFAATALANTPPVAVRDAVHTPPLPGPFVVDVLANDSDPDGDPLTIIGVADGPKSSGLRYGVVQIIDNRIHFTPTVSPGSSYSIGNLTYTISDGAGGTATALLNFTNGAPILLPDQVVSFVGMPVEIPVLANDRDPDGDPLTLRTTLPLTPSGDRIVLTPSGDAQYSYTVDDGRGGVRSTTITVKVVKILPPTEIGAFGMNVSAILSQPPPGVKIYVEYGQQSPQGQIAQATIASTYPDPKLTFPLTGLLPGRDYYYRYVLDTGTEIRKSLTLVARTLPFTYGRPELFAYRPDDSTILQYDAAGWPDTFAQKVGSGAIVFADDGLLYAAAPSRGQILRFNVKGGATAYKSGLTSPSALCFAPGGTMYVAEAIPGAGTRITVHPLQAASSTLAEKLPAISEMALGSDGHVYAAPVSPSDLIKVTTAGVVSYLSPEKDFRGGITRGPGHDLFILHPAGIQRTYDGSFFSSVFPTPYLYPASFSYGGLSAPYTPILFLALPSGQILRGSPSQMLPFATSPQRLSHLAAPRLPECCLKATTQAVLGGALVNAQVFMAGIKVSTRVGWGRKSATEIFTPWVEHRPTLGGLSIAVAIGPLTPDAGYALRLEYRSEKNEGVVYGDFRALPHGASARPDTFHRPLTGGAPMVLDVLANDGAPEYLTLHSVEQGQFGATSIVNGRVHYAPREDFEGHDSFTYTASGPFGEFTTATVTLTNGRPAATADEFRIQRGQATFLNVTENDVDPDRDSLFITAVSLPQHGSAAIVGKFIQYTPDASFRAGDSFSYTIYDGHGKSATGTVTLFTDDASIEITAASGAATDVEGGATIGGFGLPTINDAGAVAFHATLPRAARHKAGLFVIPAPSAEQTGRLPQTIATVGDPAPGLAGTRFASFLDPVLDEHGRIAFEARAVTAGGAIIEGLWSNANATAQLELIAATGKPAPVTPAAHYKSFGHLALTADGRPIFTANLHAPADRDGGLFIHTSTQGLKLELREGDQTPLPTSPRRVKSFALFGALSGTPDQRRGFSSQGDLLVRVSLVGGGETLLRTNPKGALAPITTPGSGPLSIGTVTHDGPAYFRAGPTITAQSFLATGLDYASKSTPIATLGEIAPGVPGASNARFKTLSDPVSNDAGDVAFLGTIPHSPPTTLAHNDSGLWFARQGQHPRQIIREGDPAPGIPGARLTAFTSLALPGDRGLVFTGEAVVPTHPASKSAAPTIRALWAQDRTGEFQLLLRTGENQIHSFDVLAATPSAPSQGRSANATGGLVARVTYQNRTQAILTLWVP